jgi:hypothetical protein
MAYLPFGGRLYEYLHGEVYEAAFNPAGREVYPPLCSGNVGDKFVLGDEAVEEGLE